MSIFNFNTQKNSLEGLGSRVARLESILRNLKFWEVNGTDQGAKILKRRRVTPSVTLGSVGRGEWNYVTGLSGTAIGSGSGTATYSDYLFGFTTPTTDTVTVNAGELQDSMLAVKVVASAPLTITGATTNYIYVQYAYGGTASIAVSTTRPVMDAANYREILHTWTLVGTVATLSKIYKLGTIVISGTFATP